MEAGWGEAAKPIPRFRGSTNFFSLPSKSFVWIEDRELGRSLETRAAQDCSGLLKAAEES